MGRHSTLITGYGGQSAIARTVAQAPAVQVTHRVAGVRHSSTQHVSAPRNPVRIAGPHTTLTLHPATPVHEASAAAVVHHGAGGGAGLVLQDAFVPFTVAALAITLLLIATLRLLRKPTPPDDPMY